MTHLDLCSGIGGFTLAAGWAGFQTVGFSEIDPYCCALLKQHWPDIPNYGDLRRADFSALRGGVTVLSAGVPCQPASLAGKRRGAADDRWLWSAVLDVVGAVQPAWCVLENPDGILTLDEFGGVLLRLGALGYQVRMFRVPANAVGAKHRRQRVFIVANRNSGNQRERSKSERWDQSGERSEALADAESGTRQRQTSGANGHAAQRGEALADADRAGLEEHFSRQSGQRATIERGGRINGFRFTQPPLCRRVDGIPNRSQRLKALGNSIVPQVVYPFFASIGDTDQNFRTSLLPVAEL